jgi:hypothetical protein
MVANVIEVVEVTEETIVVVKLTTSGKSRLTRLTAQNRCLGCEKELVPDAKGNPPQVRRGLCTACYQATDKALDKRRFTQTELIREGKLLPKKKPGRRPSNEFTQEMLGR